MFAAMGVSDGSITVNVVAGSGTAPYEYSLNGGPYQASATFTGLSAGSYTVTVRDANGCTISQVVTVGQPATALALRSAYGSGCSLQWGLGWEHNGECSSW
ncbi:MAG: hypothetical protein KatS3mg025_0517 [Bacteroidia bacterium]|nr:MAG: hypothetical protein KatS3mg025_0517 [Bacteroidia bacterium]